MKRIQNFINGRFENPSTERWLMREEPATGKPAVEVPDSAAADIERAVTSARSAFPSWAQRAPSERAELLMRLAQLIDDNADELAEIESADQGKPVALARSLDVPRAALNFRFFAQAILHATEETMRMDDGSFSYVTRKPLGVAGLISPWNLPLYLLTWKIAPAIAVGNTVVCKPSEMTSSTAHRLAQLTLDAGLPPGVINIVYGRGAEAGAALVAHPDVPMISFTGGTATGREIARVAGPMFKRLSLELGGKNANIIFDDCDFEQAVDSAVRSSFLNQGEICLCGSRVFVQRKLYERFLAHYADKTRALKVGDPRDEASFMGALISREHLEKVKSYVRVAREEGASIITGGESPALGGRIAGGWFFNPTIIANLPPRSRLWREEIFGPVTAIAAFDDSDEAIALANDTPYGLSATVWTQNLARAHATAQKLDVGTVWINSWMQRDLRAPFGGAKASGLGREGGARSLDTYCELKTISVRHS